MICSNSPTSLFSSNFERAGILAKSCLICMSFQYLETWDAIRADGCRKEELGAAGSSPPSSVLGSHQVLMAWTIIQQL